ncbi:DUF2309 domain-containing protein [Sphingomonas sanguinis]|uniref:Probable inorganic carbon transporter subunit DabA n=1 Tax=Sphingomonas sanguinis TaxID=33051 RepID=A0ABU5LKG1_9SPHN|nr:DUF2309 domain-containing protein [Sphingomonas sanguinis]MDZ7280419.1 DUF2309 domain-containing protein [Sphingomonas sanguinis]QXT36087.1 DUF2309 domain-containing protein [Sphingomonas sanguinis]
MAKLSNEQNHSLHELFAAADAATLAIPPAWPLAANVAVNPYLGQSGLTLAQTAALLARVGGTRVTMPRAWYRERIANGIITSPDLAAALAAQPCANLSMAQLLSALEAPSPAPTPLPTIADLAAKVSGIDWPGIIAERIGTWAAAYFDEGQAPWTLPKGKGAYASWRAVATHDLTPEIAGLRGFAAFVADAPDTATDTLASAAALLRLPAAAMPTYFHRLLLTLGGWSHYGRYRLWQAKLAGDNDDTTIDLLTIRFLWEEALWAQYEPQIGDQWRRALMAYAEPLAPTADQIVDAILQEAADRAEQRDLAGKLASGRPSDPRPTPELHAAFCIDVRSEVFRRALESVDPRIETAGFAGFFGLTAAHRRFASDVIERRLPVLLNPGLCSTAGGKGDAAADRAKRYGARASRAWDRFKLAAVSSFAFVEASGPLYVAKLVRDALGLRGVSTDNDPLPHLDPAPDIATRVTSAASILRAMSLTERFAPLVLLVGHGAQVVNNPHASALQCGACGGYSGEVNARLLASLLNDTAVRQGLLAQGIAIPAETLFIGALHDTTTDDVRLFTDQSPSPEQHVQIDRAHKWLAAAGVVARGERSLRLPRATSQQQVAARGRDWSETRPEWALAGCKAFIAAPRSRTAHIALGGRAFLHDYQWQADDGFGVLELIMTAPVVVASWISLQYYGSAVSPDTFGGGNKLLHNVVGGIGVVEGNGGTLRVGLPWQSVHDGERFAHEPVRLAICIEAPREAMSAVLAKHPDVRALFDNRWLHLFALDEAGQIAWRYAGDLAWQSESGSGIDPRPVELAA